MARSPDNQDRNFSGDESPQEPTRGESIHQLALSELFDDKAKERLGKILSAATRTPQKPRRRK